MFLCSVQRWRSACRLALGRRAAALAVEQAEREAVLQVQVLGGNSAVVALEGEAHLARHHRTSIPQALAPFPSKDAGLARNAGDKSRKQYALIAGRF